MLLRAGVGGNRAGIGNMSRMGQGWGTEWGRGGEQSGVGAGLRWGAGDH